MQCDGEKARMAHSPTTKCQVRNLAMMPYAPLFETDTIQAGGIVPKIAKMHTHVKRLSYVSRNMHHTFRAVRAH